MSKLQIEQVRVKAPDGYNLSVTVFSSKNGALPTIVMAPAMGASQDFYHPLAKWMSSKGWRVVCFDYRGLEKGAKVTREMDHSILTWATYDANSVLDFAHDQALGEQLVWFGHSLGCQLLGAMASRDKVDRVVGVATGTGYWLRGDLSLMPKAALLWFLLVPVLTPIFGYFPGKKINVVTDLPRNVIWQWRRWCLNRGYVAGAENALIKDDYDKYEIHLDILSFSDDELMSANNSSDLYKLYPKAAGRHTRLTPQEVGLKRIGHFGFFKAKQENILWPLMHNTLFEDIR